MYTMAQKLGLYPHPETMVKDVMERLKRYEPFIFHRSRDQHSIYIHFRKLPKGLDHKLRISDHDERERYGYKWQLRVDGIEFIKQKNWCRYFKDVDSLVEEFIGYYINVERSKTRSYNLDWGSNGR